MKLALAQLNTTVGDLGGNRDLIVAAAELADSNGCSLLVTPELSMCGYPPMDLLERSDFVSASARALSETAERIPGRLTAVVGAPWSRGGDECNGQSLYNAAVVLRRGQVEGVHHKVLLPQYDVFDEQRHFRQGGQPLPQTIDGSPWAITICEDIWNCPHLPGSPVPPYERDPIGDLVRQGCRYLVNISASPFHVGKGVERRAILGGTAAHHGVWLFYVNMVGGNDELVFDGDSMVFSPQGTEVARLPAFHQGLLLFDTENPSEARMVTIPAVGEGGEALSEQPSRAGAVPIAPRFLPSPTPEGDCREALVLGLRDYLRKTGLGRVMLGLSGGVDSALVAAIAVEAVGPGNVLAVSLPSRYTSRQSVEDARTLASNLAIELREIPIEPAHAVMLELMAPHFEGLREDLTEENIQARIRGNILMALSNKLGYMLLNTGNKSEVATGYCTLYGDMAGGLAVLADVYKTMVWSMCRQINREKGRELIPDSIISRAPSAELRPEQRDDDSLPSYLVLDPILEGYLEEGMSADELVEKGNEREVVDKTLGLIRTSEYKRRQMPPGLRITRKAFGVGRRIPIAQRFRD